MTAGGGCEVAVTARTRCGWVKLRVCSALLYGRGNHLKQKSVVFKSCTRPAILYGREAWCLKESEMGTSQRTEREKHGDQNV